MNGTDHFDEEKFLNAVLYFAENTDKESLGPLKLNKLLYYSDFLHFRKYGRPITGDRYVRMEHGPVPSTAYMIFGHTSGKLIKKNKKINTILTGKVDIKKGVYKNKSIARITALEDPDLSVFSDSELEILNYVASECRNKKLTGSRLSDAAHLPDSPWSKTEENQTIEYDLILDGTSKSLPREYVSYWKQEKGELAELLA